MNINLDNFSYNLKIILISSINSSSAYKDLSTRIVIKVISDFIKAIKTISNDLKLIKVIKKTLVSYY